MKSVIRSLLQLPRYSLEFMVSCIQHTVKKKKVKLLIKWNDDFDGMMNISMKKGPTVDFSLRKKNASPFNRSHSGPIIFQVSTGCFSTELWGFMVSKAI